VRVRILTLRYDPVLDAFDETRLQELVKANRVLAVRDHFFETESGPRLALGKSARKECQSRRSAIVRGREW